MTSQESTEEIEYNQERVASHKFVVPEEQDLVEDRLAVIGSYFAVEDTDLVEQGEGRKWVVAHNFVVDQDFADLEDTVGLVVDYLEGVFHILDYYKYGQLLCWEVGHNSLGAQVDYCNLAVGLDKPQAVGIVLEHLALVADTAQDTVYVVDIPVEDMVELWAAFPAFEAAYLAYFYSQAVADDQGNYFVVQVLEVPNSLLVALEDRNLEAAKMIRQFIT